jgi:hypothetical protein
LAAKKKVKKNKKNKKKDYNFKKKRTKCVGLIICMGGWGTKEKEDVALCEP